jgi:N-acetylglutamate synthase-like GNAT family acetyltransferase
LGIQNHEFGLALSLEEQPDLADIDATYLKKGGAFWVAQEAEAIVGCIGLAAVATRYGVVKKFFVNQNFRGRDRGVSAQLFSALIEFAHAHGFKAIFLDTPSVATRSHAFYRRAGFVPVSRSELPVPYEYPDRDSILFMLDLTAHGDEQVIAAVHERENKPAL